VTCGTVIVVAVLTYTAPLVQAAVLNRRLEAIVNGPNPKSKAAEAQSIVNLASEGHVKLKPRLVLSAVESVGVERPDWEEMLAAINRRYDPEEYNNAFATNKTKMNINLDNQRSLSYTDFKELDVTYGGSPIWLVHVSFKNVAFRITDNENGRKFAQALMDSKDGEISVSIP
jgi:hypothetical protein